VGGRPSDYSVNTEMSTLPLIGLDPSKGLAVDEIYFTLARHLQWLPCDWNALTAALATADS
jgi:hypothetical protein